MIKEELKNKSNSAPAPFAVTKSERILVEKIMLKTKEDNLNNVKRTRAYLDFYLRFPDIHWAFLGHMVSRNGGWNMTDLKGEFLTRLMTKKDRVLFFQF